MLHNAGAVEPEEIRNGSGRRVGRVLAEMSEPCTIRETFVDKGLVRCGQEPSQSIDDVLPPVYRHGIMLNPVGVAVILECRADIVKHVELVNKFLEDSRLLALGGWTWRAVRRGC